MCVPTWMSAVPKGASAKRGFYPGKDTGMCDI